MAITFTNLSPNAAVIELGGGSNPQFRPNVDVRVCHDANGNPTVDFTADFDSALPIRSDEWDCVFGHYVIEHVSWRALPGFVAEVLRILKPGGKAVFVTANTPAQIQWIANNPQGWDGKPFFESASCVLFGDQDYPENAHKNYMSFIVAETLFKAAGFAQVACHPYGERDTDMVIEAVKSVEPQAGGLLKIERGIADPNHVPFIIPPIPSMTPQPPPVDLSRYTRAELFDKEYFNGGGKVGGYSREGYRDFPVHEVTARHILARKPKTAMEIGSARGYVVKRLQDAGVRAYGVEISKHCFLTRACNDIHTFDICEPWNLPDDWKVDLCYSVATLEHIPEEHIGHVIREMAKYSERGLHGIDFGEGDDGFDKTHVALFDRSKWLRLFAEHAPDYPVEIVDKEVLERGEFPPEVLAGDGKVKLNIGSFTTMHHHGWTNIDVHDLDGFARANGYRYMRHDVRNGLPWATGTVDLLAAQHMLEHLTYREGLALLRECRRVLKPDGVMRVAVPDAGSLAALYVGESVNFPNVSCLADLDEIRGDATPDDTDALRFWKLLHDGHQAAYDVETMQRIGWESGFRVYLSEFRKPVGYDGTAELSAARQVLRETIDMMPCLSLYVWLVPLLG